MKTLLIKLLTYIGATILFFIAFPFMFLYTLIKSFWKIFGTTIIAFIIIGLFGGTLNQCVEYSTSLGFFVGVLLMFVERDKN